MTATESPNSTVKRAISLPPELAAAAEKRAKADNRNFSNYIQSLIAGDLKAHPEEGVVGPLAVEGGAA